MGKPQELQLSKEATIGIARAFMRSADAMLKEISEQGVMKILIQVEGGTVQSVYATGEGVPEVLIQDYDNGSAEGFDDTEYDTQHWFADGQTVAKFLEQVQLHNPNYKQLA